MRIDLGRSHVGGRHGVGQPGLPTGPLASGPSRVIAIPYIELSIINRYVFLQRRASSTDRLEINEARRP